jgi:hypothetical protein
LRQIQNNRILVGKRLLVDRFNSVGYSRPARITLIKNLNLKEIFIVGATMWAGVIWLLIGISGNFYEHGNEPADSI